MRTHIPRWPLTPGWATAALALTIVLAVLAEGIASLALLAAVLTLAVCSGGVKPGLARRWPLWASAAALVGISAFAIGELDSVLWGVTFSSTGLRQGLWMGVRALTIALAAGWYANTVSVSDLTRLFERVGLGGLGFALGVAFNMLPTLRAEVHNTFDAMRLRGGFRRRRLAHFRLLAVVVITNALRHADDIVRAAEVRAFRAGPDKGGLP
jgi:energy-coupling factor transporter transmembrane protein EcfT